MQRVEIRIAIAIRPPQPRLRQPQRRRIGRRKLHHLARTRLQLHLALEGNRLPRPVARRNRSLHHALHRLVGKVLHRRLHRHIALVGAWQRQVGRHQRAVYARRTGRGQIHLLPDARGAIANRRQPIPSNRAQKRGPINGALAAVLPNAVAQRMLVAHARMRLRTHAHRHHRMLAGHNVLRHVKPPANESALRCAHLRTVHPHFGRVVNAVEVQPHMPALVRLRHQHFGAIPIRCPRQALWNPLRPVVFSVQRLRVNLVVHQRRQHRARHRCGIPTARHISRRRNLRSRAGHLGHILQLPAGSQLHARRRGSPGQRQRAHQPGNQQRKTGEPVHWHTYLPEILETAAVTGPNATHPLYQTKESPPCDRYQTAFSQG